MHYALHHCRPGSPLVLTSKTMKKRQNNGGSLYLIFLKQMDIWDYKTNKGSIYVIIIDLINIVFHRNTGAPSAAIDTAAEPSE